MFKMQDTDQGLDLGLKNRIRAPLHQFKGLQKSIERLFNVRVGTCKFKTHGEHRGNKITVI